jgi:organic radical activating enzyme
MSNKIFPIKNDAACVFKWGWNTFRLHDATSSSCHRVQPVHIELDDFDNFHNTPAAIEDRQRMLDNQWPQAGRGCEYCKDIEDLGGVSDRTFHNNIPGLTPVDFDINTNQVTPRILEIYLSNTCDLACVYCMPIFSSRINDELKRYGSTPVGLQYISPLTNRAEYLNKFLAWLDNNYGKIKRLSIQGGEPLLQIELSRFLEFMEQHQNPTLEVTINSNLNCKPDRLKEFVEFSKRLIEKKKIRRLDINCSLDCWGPQAEFVRYGLDLSTWEKNFEYLITNRWLTINVQHVLTSLSIFTTKELQDKISEYKKINPNITQAYHIVDGANEIVYRPEIFGGEFYSEYLDELVSTYPIVREWDNNAKQRLEGLAKLIKSSTRDVERLKMLKTTLDQLDFRRKTNWRELFPKIDEYFNSNGIK